MTTLEVGTELKNRRGVMSRVARLTKTQAVLENGVRIRLGINSRTFDVVGDKMHHEYWELVETPAPKQITITTIAPDIKTGEPIETMPCFACGALVSEGINHFAVFCETCKQEMSTIETPVELRQLDGEFVAMVKPTIETTVIEPQEPETDALDTLIERLEAESDGEKVYDSIELNGKTYLYEMNSRPYLNNQVYALYRYHNCGSIDNQLGYAERRADGCLNAFIGERLIGRYEELEDAFEAIIEPPAPVTVETPAPATINARAEIAQQLTPYIETSHKELAKAIDINPASLSIVLNGKKMAFDTLEKLMTELNLAFRPQIFIKVWSAKNMESLDYDSVVDHYLNRPKDFEPITRFNDSNIWLRDAYTFPFTHNGYRWRTVKVGKRSLVASISEKNGDFRLCVLEV